MLYALLAFYMIFYTLYKIYEVLKRKRTLEREVEESYEFMMDSIEKFRARFK